jgi:hypothetical protein
VTRSIPAKVQREVEDRAGGRCQVPSASTHKFRCSPRRNRRSWQGARTLSNAGHLEVRATPPGAARPSEMYRNL